VKIVAFTGESGSGKTTAIAGLIAHFVANGQTAGAIKHTHHVINEEDRGDTAVFRRAGADPVVLAGAEEAVVFSASGTRRITFTDPRELVSLFDAGVVFIEGWKSIAGDAWPRVELSRASRHSTQDLLVILDRIWRP
jgi:molybdopterin-guanine dinucleotide biosynthesis protein B